MSSVSVQIEGLGPLLRALRDDAGLADVMRKALWKIGAHADEASKREAPVDVGKLRGSIMFQVDPSPLPGFVRIGTIGPQRPTYAAFMEFGTGLRHDHPNWPRRPHVVPPAALQRWARRKSRSGEDFNAFSIARAITARGGLEPRRYLRGPFEANQARYVAEIRTALGRLTLRG